MKRYIWCFGLIVSSILISQTVRAEVGAIRESPLQFGTAADLVAQGVTRVTGVEVIQTESGFELILETVAGSERLVPLILPEGNDLVIDILDATLAFSIRNGVTELNPAPGITEVTVNKVDENSVRVRITGENQTPSAEVLTGRDDLVLSITPEGTTADTEPVEEIEVIATGEAEEDEYRVDSATTATRTDTPLRDIPQSIQVVPRQVIEDQKVTRVGEALQNVSGVTDAGLFGNYLDYIWLRGFPTFSGNFFLDGVRQTNYFTGAFGVQELGNLERVEVLKGPASVLFGAVEPGGVINFITKSPLTEPRYSFDLSAGNFDSYRGEIDLGGPLNEQKTILYRLNGIYDNSGSFRDFVDSERITVAPTVSFEFSPRTSLRIDSNFSRLETLPDSGIPAVGDRPADVPRERSIDEPFSNFISEDLSIGYTLEHKFNDNWSLRNIFRYQSFDVPEFIAPLASSFDEATGELERATYSQTVDFDSYSVQADVIGEFSTGSIEHTLLIGAEFNLTKQDRRLLLFANPYPSINIFNPVYANQTYDITPTNFIRDDEFIRYGFYIQDQVTVLPQLKLLLGGRYDIFDQERIVVDPPPQEQIFEQTDSKFTPRLGLVYQPSDTVSLYASYATSFQPSLATSRNPDGSDFEPTTGTQYEIGVKTDFLDGRLSTTLAGFIIERQNVPTADPENPEFSIVTGEQTSQGIELDITGEILPGWDVIASATYLDATVTEDNTIPEGNRLQNAAETSASLWTTYRIQSGDLSGLGFGLGFYYVGDRFGDLDNSFILPSYFRTDAALYYERNNWDVALNVRNLFDVTYFSGSSGSRTNGINFGEPFTIVGSFSVEF